MIGLFCALTACNGQIARQQTLSRDAPPPEPQAQTVPAQQPGFPNSRPDALPPGTPDENRASQDATQNSYQSAQDAYRAALSKAASDHKSALENCESLAKAARNSCVKDADARLKVAKAEAAKLKPVS